MKRLVFLFLILFSINSFGQKIEWYLPWENRLSHLIKDDPSVAVPIILGQNNYRILKLSLDKGVSLEQLNVESDNSDVDIYYAPVISDYDNRQIIDVLLPMNTNDLNNSSTYYFFVDFKGIKPGLEKVAINIKTNKSTDRAIKDIYISSKTDPYLFSINTWAYLDYDFLVNGLKDQQVQDMHDSRNDYLLIAHAHFPKVEQDIDKERVEKLKSYLKGTEDKFQHYVLFFDYRPEYTSILSEKWKSAFLDWIKVINKTFAELGISSDRVLLYPYDEPQGETIQKAENFFDWIRQQEIENPLFVTIGGKDREKALRLAGKFDYVQVASSLVEKASSVKGADTKLLIYAVWGRSRGIRPKTYLGLGSRAYKNDAIGVGVWSYSGMKGAIDSASPSTLKAASSWTLPVINQSKDYSLVYRSGNRLYSSIRWKALAYTYDEYNFFKLYEKKFGKNGTVTLIDQDFNNQMSWERVKLNYLKKYYN